MARLQIPVQLRWSDVDAYAHVNNVAMLTILEESRIEAFWRHPQDDMRDAVTGGPDPGPGPGIGRAGVSSTSASPGLAASGDAGGGPRRQGHGWPRQAWPTAVLDAGPGALTSTLVARQEVEYLVPLAYQRDPVLVEMWIGHLGGASLDVCYEVRDGVVGEPASDGAEQGAANTVATVYARAVTTIVLVDAGTGRPRRLGAAERSAWEPYVEEPVRFRRRGH